MQNQADSGTVKTQVNPTQVCQEMGHPVLTFGEMSAPKDPFESINPYYIDELYIGGEEGCRGRRQR